MAIGKPGAIDRGRSIAPRHIRRPYRLSGNTNDYDRLIRRGNYRCAVVYNIENVWNDMRIMIHSGALSLGYDRVRGYYGINIRTARVRDLVVHASTTRVLIVHAVSFANLVAP